MKLDDLKVSAAELKANHSLNGYESMASPSLAVKTKLVLDGGAGKPKSVTP